MAVITMENAEIAANAGNVALRVPVDGRRRTLNIDPVDAVQIANLIATQAIKLAPVEAPASMRPLGIKLHPYAEGFAHLVVETEHGPFVFAFDGHWLQALALAAEAALEFGEAGGSA